jgi:pimeloyl-ACP methyl ester carboxylesterase
VDRERVGVCGASYGGYLTALLTARRPVKRLILRAPSLVEDIALPPWQRPPSASREVPERFDSLRLLRRYDGEVLIVESEMDEVIPASHIDVYLSACSHAEREVIPCATHALTEPKWDEIFVNMIIKWFRVL